PTERQRVGALALGGFGGVGLATVLSPVLHLDGDVAADAAAVDALWTGAGAGAGALLGTSDKAPVWGMLGAGAVGLLVGGALHDSIEIGAADAPLLTLAGTEGLWLGGWFPYLVHDRAQVTEREELGALALGGFGGVGLATLASGAFDLAPARAGVGALGSGLGAAMGGGLALMSPSSSSRAGVGLMMGGTALGLAAGATIAPRLSDAPTERLVGGTALGAGLGISESLLFAWSGNVSSAEQYRGAALFGGGLGAALGLAASAAPESEHGSAPAAAGFAAWGAWTGAFAGSLFKNDTHDDVMGGLIGANAGFLAGYALMRADVVDPRDFGWLSLFGALGTVAGAGVGAPFSTSGSTPVRAGLAIGPAAGMIAGALVLPRLHSAMAARATALSDRAPAGSTASEPVPGALAQNDDARGTPAENGATEQSSLAHRMSQVGEVTDWAPLVGALPASPDSGPSPVLFGVTGHWK
ncbi:MAG TPA: hypothetical protein VK989_12890, partial [Polyangia bacterium]|nr:hypothetical protein [Polyangia bacterium]